MVRTECERRSSSKTELAQQPKKKKTTTMRASRRKRQQQGGKMRECFCGGLTLIMLLGFVFFHTQQERINDMVMDEGTRSNLRRGNNNNNNNKMVWITPDAQPFNQNSVATLAKNLIVVAGHSVVIAGNLDEAGTDESVWYLLDYQKGVGMPQAILGHIRAGIEEANRDPDALLIFSGGQTRPVTGTVSEGSSYFQVADAMKLWPSGSTVRARTAAEEFATDSFENLLFSICRFREVTGNYPSKITMVSFTFKQRRFETMHAPSLQWSSDRFQFVGVDPPASTGFDLAKSTQGELENAARPFEKDPYGCHSQVLQEKRKNRNPFHRTAPYSITCPEIAPLLRYCGPDPYPKEDVPWR